MLGDSINYFLGKLKLISPGRKPVFMMIKFDQHN